VNTSTNSAWPSAKYIGRVGALAVVPGVEAALATADASQSTSSSDSASFVEFVIGGFLALTEFIELFEWTVVVGLDFNRGPTGWRCIARAAPTPTRQHSRGV
jgi:hypothetical protein